MVIHVPNEGPILNSVRRRLEPLASQHGVTVERVIEVVRARRRFKRAAYYRKRSRRRSLTRNPKARFSPFYHTKTRYAGEGDLHALLRMSGMSQKEFCAVVGIRPSTFRRWYGHPIHSWPVEFLRHYVWLQNALVWVRKNGGDPESLKPVIPEQETPTGRYPRKRGDLTIHLPADPDWSPWDAVFRTP